MNLDRAARHVTDHLQRRREAPIAVRVSPDEIRAHLRDRYPFTRPVSLERVFDDVTGMLWRWSEHKNNPRHFGLFQPGRLTLMLL